MHTWHKNVWKCAFPCNPLQVSWISNNEKQKQIQTDRGEKHTETNMFWCDFPSTHPHMFLYVFGWPHAPLLRQHVLYGCPNRGPTFSNLIFLKYEVYYWICKEPALYENHLEVIRGLSNQEVSQRVSIKKKPIATYFRHFDFWEKKQIFFILMPKAWFKVEKFRLLQPYFLYLFATCRFWLFWLLLILYPNLKSYSFITARHHIPHIFFSSFLHTRNFSFECEI